MKSSEQYLIEAADAAELARQQTHAPAAMAAHTARGRLLLELSRTLVEREAAGLEPVTTPDPVAVLDCHDRRWDRRPDGQYRQPGGISRHTYQGLMAQFGPLRPAEVSR